MLINLRNALMAGKRLPYDAEVEYLESTGTQWIDTGIVPDNLTGVKISMYVPSVSSTWKSWGGCRRSAGDSSYSFNMQYQSSYCPNGRMTVGGGTVSTLLPSSAISGDCKWEYIVSGNTGTLTVNGVVVGSHVSSTVWSTDVEMTLFAGNNGGNKNENSSGFKIYRVEIFSESLLVRDYIPVRVGAVGYMYDRVSGKLFGNAGTGDFMLGPDVVQVEWLDFTGTQCLDLGFYPTQATITSIEIIPSVTGTSNIGWISAGNGSGVKYESYGWGNRAQMYYGNEYATNWSVYAGDHIKIELGKNTKYENITQGTTYSKTFTDTTFTAAYNLTIGALNRGRYSYFAQMRLNSASIAGNRTMNMLPVRVGTEGAMMDVLTRRIYRNKGTGAFTYGNDLKYPIPAE